MRFALFACFLLACLVLTKAQEYRYSKVQEFLEKYPILIKYGDWVDIVENETFKMPRHENQHVGYSKGKDGNGSAKVRAL